MSAYIDVFDGICFVYKHDIKTSLQTTGLFGIYNGKKILYLFYYYVLYLYALIE
jgi:hypothetical protein